MVGGTALTQFGFQFAAQAPHNGLRDAGCTLCVMSTGGSAFMPRPMPLRPEDGQLETKRDVHHIQSLVGDEELLPVDDERMPLTFCNAGGRSNDCVSGWLV